ncbi:hypothetical protein MASAN616_03850 [Streptococcus sp. SN-1]|uniref:Uncharacterized protein n=1 Tax=Streptococcus sp. SN-1 TaxID=3074854 RepID=A0AAT9FZA5_9STRE
MLALADRLVDTDSEVDTLSLTELDRLAEFSASTFAVVPRTTVSCVARASELSNVFSRATASFAKTFV